MSSVALEKFGVLGKVSETNHVSVQQTFNRIPLLMYRYRGSFHSDNVATVDNDTCAIINTQPIKMQDEQGIRISKSGQIWYVADSLGPKKYSFPKQHEQMIPEPLQSHPIVCDFYTIYAAIHPFKFQQAEITEVHDANVLSSINNDMF